MIIQGSIVALVTPMDNQGGVDYQKLNALIDYHIEQKTHAIVSVGTTGESATLMVDEHLQVIEQTINHVAKRIPVIAGTGGNSTQEAILLTREAERLGADAALLVVPYYNKPMQQGLYQHFKTIADAVAIPQILYNVPSRTGADMDNLTIARLADVDNIVACKDATGDLLRGKELIELCGERIAVLSGDDATALDLMKLGAKGDISVTANVAPKLMSEMCEAALRGDFELAESIDKKLQGLHQSLFLESNPIPVKYAVSQLGYTQNVLRLPLTPLSEEFHQQVNTAMSRALDV
jgi:4-hydroxy-tetrahydrodipicolinate synthase